MEKIFPHMAIALERLKPWVQFLQRHHGKLWFTLSVGHWAYYFLWFFLSAINEDLIGLWWEEYFPYAEPGGKLWRFTMTALFLCSILSFKYNPQPMMRVWSAAVGIVDLILLLLPELIAIVFALLLFLF